MTETGVAAPGSDSDELIATLDPEAGTCADTLDSDTAQALACRWIANADIAVCPWFTDRLLEELFGGRREGCELMIGRLAPAEDKAAIRFSEVRSTDGGVSMTVDDGPRAARYQITFVYEDGSWHMDTVTTERRRPPADTVEARERDPRAEEEIRMLALRWYRDVDPDVCDAMTDDMLDFGWAKTGQAGRDLCRDAVASAEPLESVKVRRPIVNGDRAKVKVLYTQGGERLIDELRLVREDGAWLIDTVRLSGFVP